MEKYKTIRELTPYEWMLSNEKRKADPQFLEYSRDIFKRQREGLLSIMPVVREWRDKNSTMSNMFDELIESTIRLYISFFERFLSNKSSPILGDYKEIINCNFLLVIFETDLAILKLNDYLQIIEDVQKKYEIELIKQRKKVEILKIEPSNEYDIFKDEVYEENKITPKMFSGFYMYALKNTLPLAIIELSDIEEHIVLLAELNKYVKNEIVKLEILKKKPLPAEPKGFNLGLTEEQLKALHQQLMDKKFLSKNTSTKHFINAFNGEVLKDFERLEWHKSIVVLTIFIGAIDSFKEQENKWQKTQLVFKDVNADNLRKTYSSQSGLEKHKPNNLLFIQMLDGLRTV